MLFARREVESSRNFFNLAARVNSDLLRADAQIASFMESGLPLYPPTFVIVNNRFVDYGLSSRAPLLNNAVLEPVEAAAALFLLSKLCIAAESGSEKVDVIEGGTRFGKVLGIVAGIRAMLKQGELPLRREGEQSPLEEWFDLYAQPLRDDGLQIGVQTTTAINRSLRSALTTEGKNQKDLTRGIELAGVVYLQGLRISRRQFPG